jgi:hypothetical protein
MIIIGLVIIVIVQLCLSSYQQSIPLSSSFEHLRTTLSSMRSLSLSNNQSKQMSTSWTTNVTDQSIPFHHDYPRPHLRRQYWYNLNGQWSFTITPRSAAIPRDYDGTILVPYPVESILSGRQERVDASMFLWYKRLFNMKAMPFTDDEQQSMQLLLHFDKVDFETVVYINGNRMKKKHRGGYDPFVYDITSFIDTDADNELVVRVWDPSNHGYQARGKQMLDVDERNSIFYTPCSGIWGTVWLEKVPQVRIDRVQFRTKISSVNIQWSYRIDLTSIEQTNSDNEQENLLEIPREEFRPTPLNIDDSNAQDFQLKIRLFNADGEQVLNIVSNRTNVDNEIDVRLSTIQLWSPEQPYLYTVHIELYEMGQFVERIQSYYGFRHISLCSNPKRICLNNRPYFMFGVLDQGYWPDGLYRASTDDAYKQDIKHMKRLGFNTLRKHMKVETSRWYYWCDVLGMLVWQDMPAGDSFYGYESELKEDKQLRQHRDNRTNELPTTSSPTGNLYRPKNLQRAFRSKVQFERELKAMIDYFGFHPSIIVWVLFNEEWGQYDTIRLTAWLEYYDSDRLINAASGWQDRVGIGHMRDIHDYTDHIFLPKIDDDQRALVLGECGGFGLKKFGWSYNSYNDQYFLTYAFEQLIVHRSNRLSAMIYTQLSDVENESNGILTYDRREQKFIGDHLYRVLNNDYTRLYRLEHLWNLTVVPYTNYTSLRLSASIQLNRTMNASNVHQLYFYTCYLYSIVHITVDRLHHLVFNQTHLIPNYHYISLPETVFATTQNDKHSLDIVVHYLPSFEDHNLSYVYTNRTYFYLTLAMLSE